MLCLTIILSLLYQAVFCFVDSHVTMGTDELQSGNQSEQTLKPSETKTEILDETSQHPQGKGVYCIRSCSIVICMDIHHTCSCTCTYVSTYTADTNSRDPEIVLQPRDSHSITSDDEDNDSQGDNPVLYM